MTPTIRDGGDLLLLRKYNISGNINKGDVVVYISPISPDKPICKRIVRLPGDKIPQAYIRRTSEADVQEQALDDQKTLSNWHGNFSPYYSNQGIVPPGHVWVEGDNPVDSMDSRYYGPIPIGLIYAKAICKILPLSEFGKPLHFRKHV